MRHATSAAYLRFLALCFALNLGASQGPNFWKWRDLVELQKHEGLIEQLIGLNEVDGWVSENYITQPLDHFNPTVKDVYKQRYWVNFKYWKMPFGPVFLYIGGEGALSNTSVKTGEHVDLARKYGALLFSVEHRYYGASINDDGLQLQHLQYLSSQQALADLATFYTYATQKYALSTNNTWICFGGSYSGALSAWFRLKYPHLVYGSVASSAPVRAVTDFQGYNDVVAASLKDVTVNGSTQCLLNFKKAFATIDGLIEAGKFIKLQTDFLSCNNISSHYDTVTFVTNLAGVIMGVVQYNEEANLTTIDDLCKQMEPSDDPYAALISINKMSLKEMKMNCSDNSWENFIKLLLNTKVQRLTSGVGLRQWLYQTCTQFGYYQTCERNTSCPFSAYLDLDSNLKVCADVFNISAREVMERVRFTNSYYGADQPKGSRIVFVNGSIDPWHALSVLHRLLESETAIYINGTAHCANMASGKKGDPQSLIAARKMIDIQIGQWLYQAKRAPAP